MGSRHGPQAVPGGVLLLPLPQLPAQPPARLPHVPQPGGDPAAGPAGRAQPAELWRPHAAAGSHTVPARLLPPCARPGAPGQLVTVKQHACLTPWPHSCWRSAEPAGPGSLPTSCQAPSLASCQARPRAVYLGSSGPVAAGGPCLWQASWTCWPARPAVHGNARHASWRQPHLLSMPSLRSQP